MSLTKTSYSLIAGAPINVLDYGADASGVADSTSAIASALDAVASGGTLFFPPGTYKVTSAISKVFADGVTVKLIGYGAKIEIGRAHV